MTVPHGAVISKGFCLKIWFYPPSLPLVSVCLGSLIPTLFLFHNNAARRTGSSGAGSLSLNLMFPWSLLNSHKKSILSHYCSSLTQRKHLFDQTLVLCHNCAILPTRSQTQTDPDALLLQLSSFAVGHSVIPLERSVIQRVAQGHLHERRQGNREPFAINFPTQIFLSGLGQASVSASRCCCPQTVNTQFIERTTL